MAEIARNTEDSSNHELCELYEELFLSQRSLSPQIYSPNSSAIAPKGAPAKLERRRSPQSFKPLIYPDMR